MPTVLCGNGDALLEHRPVGSGCGTRTRQLRLIPCKVSTPATGACPLRRRPGGSARFPDASGTSMSPVSQAAHARHQPRMRMEHGAASYHLDHTSEAGKQETGKARQAMKLPELTRAVGALLPRHTDRLASVVIGGVVVCDTGLISHASIRPAASMRDNPQCIQKQWHRQRQLDVLREPAKHLQLVLDARRSLR